jgi:hypothetical protein
LDRRGTGALLLVVLIAVLIILLLYFAGGSGSYMNQVKKTRQSGRQVATEISVQQFSILIAQFRQTNGRLPKNVEDMGDDAASFIDPWGNRVTFTIEDTKNGPTKVRYHSPGPDKEEGTPDDINKTDTLPY